MLSLALVSLGALSLIWIGYPLVIATLAALRRPTRRGEAGWTPAVSVIIATRDAPAAVRARVEDCLAADYDATQLEVIVSVDAACEGLDQETLDFPHPHVRVVRGDAPGGKAAALNAGVRASRGEVVVFTDTYQRFTPQTIRRLVDELADPRTAAASGCLDLPRRVGGGSLTERYWLFERWLRDREAQVHSAVGMTGAVCALRRSLWKALPEGLILDDLYTPMRLVLEGYRIGFVRSARATETRASDPTREYYRKMRTLTGVIQVCAWLPGVLLPARNPVWLQFVCHKLLRLATPYLLLLGGIGVLGTLIERRSFGSRGGIATAAGMGLLILGSRGGVWRGGREALLLLAAVFMATLNGLRGEWDVWQR